jgi:hypothetical protein
LYSLKPLYKKIKGRLKKKKKYRRKLLVSKPRRLRIKYKLFRVKKGLKKKRSVYYNLYKSKKKDKKLVYDVKLKKNRVLRKKLFYLVENIFFEVSC